MPDLPTGTVTFLFTDVEGSTRQWELHPQTMRAAVPRHITLLRQAVERSGGVVFKTVGDGACAAFPTAPQAVSAALSAQRALGAEPWGDVGPLRVRMALHAGAVELQDGDYVGPCLNRVGRLLGLARGGQVLVSDVASDLAADSLPEGASLRDLGEHRLRDLVRAEHIYQLVHPELLVDFPPLRSLDAHPSNLPVQLTSFIGREREIAEVKRLLGTTRLLTLIGTGGCGKTRLALEVSRSLLKSRPPEYSEGVWLVELAALSESELIPRTAATALGVQEQPGRPIQETLTAFLHTRRLLLILDNCEHLLDACAAFAHSILQACPSLRILATSREALGILGETSLRVPSLSVPDINRLPSIEPLTQFEAVRLFVERARAVRTEFVLTGQNASDIARICVRLDGIPLALELAAARLRGLTVAQLCHRLDDRFRLLTTGSRTALPRQQTLRTTIDWSHDLLSPPEKVLFRRLAVFAGGWTLGAAEGVCAGGEGAVAVNGPDVLDLLLRLVDRSLVLAEEVAEESRYHFLETIRQYAQEQLLGSGEVERVRERHLEWCVSLAERAEPELLSANQRAWAERLDAELDNLRAALHWSQGRGPSAEAETRLVAALGFFWVMRGYYAELRQVLNSVVNRGHATPPDRWAKVLRFAGYAERSFGNLTRAEALHAEGVAAARQLGDSYSLADALLLMSMLQSDRGDYDEALALREEALVQARESADKQKIAHVLMHLGAVEQRTGNLEAARAHLEEGVTLGRAAGDAWVTAGCLNGLAEVCQREGDLQRARELLEEALARGRSVGVLPLTLITLTILGGVSRRQRDYDRALGYFRECLTTVERMGVDSTFWALGPVLQIAGLSATMGRASRAARLFGALDAFYARAGRQMPYDQHEQYEDDLTTTRASLGEAGWARTWAEGQAMTLEQAVEYALQDGEG